jgi:hypothetical protein
MPMISRFTSRGNGEEKSLLPLPEIEFTFLVRPALSLVDIMTELAHLTLSYIYIYIHSRKQEVLGRTNPLLSFDTTRTAYKTKKLAEEIYI